MLKLVDVDSLGDKVVPWLIFSAEKILLPSADNRLPRAAWCELTFIHHYSNAVNCLSRLDDVADSAEPIYVVDMQSEKISIEGWQEVTLRDLLTVADSEGFQQISRAWQYLYFLRTHNYCGRCGSSTQRIDWEVAVQCGHCGHRCYPRVSPCIITAIYRDDQILLANGVRHKESGMYSTLAGFVESGESLEHALHREVREEVGITVKNLTYFGSQAWPFPHSLMVGYIAEYAGGDIVIDEREIVDAQWFSIDALPKIPPMMSIAGHLIAHVIEKIKQTR